jgi:hypothetical protein
MKKNNPHSHLWWLSGIGAMAACLVISVSPSKAEVAVGNVQATVVSPLSVQITPAPFLSGAIVSVEEANRRATAGTPVLRISAPPPGAGPAITAAATTVKAASSTAVSVTVNPDGSLSVSGQGNGIAFTVTQPSTNAVTIEYN